MTWVRINSEKMPEPSRNPLGSALEIYLVLRLYFIVYPSHFHNTDKVLCSAAIGSFTRLESLAWSKQGFWHASFCRKHLCSLCFVLIQIFVQVWLIVSLGLIRSDRMTKFSCLSCLLWKGFPTGQIRSCCTLPLLSTFFWDKGAGASYILPG